MRTWKIQSGATLVLQHVALVRIDAPHKDSVPEFRHGWRIVATMSWGRPILVRDFGEDGRDRAQVEFQNLLAELGRA